MKKALSLVIAAGLAACNGNFGATEQGALGAGALGAGLGAIVGHETGNTGAGIAIGAATGILAGGLFGRQVDKQREETARRDERINNQDAMIAENQRLIDELRRRGTDVRETDRGVVVNLPDVLFEFDKARLTAEARDTARQIAEVLRGVEDRKVAVEGHTDSIGTITYNQRLSEDRARSVADELVAHGISRGRISARGLGENDPIASNKTESGRARNRRVEVIIENRR